MSLTVVHGFKRVLFTNIAVGLDVEWHVMEVELNPMVTSNIFLDLTPFLDSI